MKDFLRENRLLVLIIAALLFAGFLLRVFNLGHVLSYDEAWNANTIASVAAGSTDDVFFNNFYRHPPLYDGIGVLVKFMAGGNKQALAVMMEIISILFSLGLMLMLLLCGRDWFGLEAGIFAAILFMLMPAARVYDTFIKPESLTLLLCLLFAFFFFRERYVVAGIFLGFGALSKETFIFIPIALLLYLLVTWQKNRFRGFAISAGLSVLMSFWWYIFLSKSKGEFLDFFFGRSLESLNWGRPIYYYLNRLPRDIGWITMILGAVAVGLFLYEVFASYRWAGLREDNPISIALFCFIWIFVTYFVISISHGKPPWMVYSALPAIALLSGWSLQEILELMEEREKLGYAIVTVVLAAAFIMSVTVGFGSFMKAADPTFTGAETHKKVAEYINDNDGDQKVMLRVNDLSPNLAFYLDEYRPGSIYEFPAVMADIKDRPDNNEHTVFLVNKDTESGEVLSIIESYPPGFFVIRTGIPTTDGIDIANLLADYVKPVKIGNMRIFNGKEIMRNIEDGYL